MKIVSILAMVVALGICPATPAEEREAGNAGYYSDWFAGKTMANGETVDQDELTASIASYPFDTTLRVTSVESSKSVVVRVTDRPGPRTAELIVLTRAAAEELGFLDSGRARVEIEVVEMGEGEVAAPATRAAKEKRRERGGLAEPGKKPSPFAASDREQ